MIQFFTDAFAEIPEPLTVSYDGITAVSIDLVARNVGTEELTGLGLYIRNTSASGVSVEFISNKSTTEMLDYVIQQGNDDLGITVDLGDGPIRITTEVGSSLETKIPVTYNSGTLAPDEEFTFTLTYEASVLTAEQLGIDIVVV